MAGSGALLRARGLQAGYGRRRILFGVDLDAEAGRVTAVVGPNGSGKSTLLRAVFGMCSVHAGSVELAGEDITGGAPHAVARRGVAYLPQTRNVFEALSVGDNMAMAAYAVPPRERAGRRDEALGAFPFLRSSMGARAGSLSGGQRQMLAMAMALVRRPRAMLFDEPTANLSPKLAGEALSRISGLASGSGIAVVLVEQNARRALAMADGALLLAGGRAAFSGPAGELLAHPELGRLYLGLGR